MADNEVSGSRVDCGTPFRHKTGERKSENERERESERERETERERGSATDMIFGHGDHNHPLHHPPREADDFCFHPGDSGCKQENTLVATWLYDWAWGLIKTPTLQRYATAAINSKFSNPLMVKIASLGTRGTYHGNMHGQLLSWVTKVHGNVSWGIYMCPPGSRFDFLRVCSSPYSAPSALLSGPCHNSPTTLHRVVIIRSSSSGCPLEVACRTSYIHICCSRTWQSTS